jgi:hypothetical protein
MGAAPPNPRIYHITPVENLTSIIADGGIVSDATMIARGGPPVSIGMSTIKRRRVEELEVDCHPGTKVGDYVPFYFCPRSIMLFVIHRANHPELAYKGGQRPIVHLEADLQRVVAWAASNGRRWAFSLSNAGARYAQFRASLADLGDIDWAAVAASDFRPRWVKEGKQAEFLLFDRFPWELVDTVGVHSAAIKAQVGSALSGVQHRPSVKIQRSWYY